MVKRQVLLSIDDLKQLGIIKKYLRKKRKNKKKKLINNNIRQNINYMMGYSDVINNQQQVYRNNDLDNEKKRFEIMNLEQTNQKNQLLLENPNYFSNPNDEFENRIMSLENDMNNGKNSVGNIYKIIQDINRKPASESFIGKNEDIETVDYKDIFEQVGDQLLEESNNPMNDLQPEDINIPNQDDTKVEQLDNKMKELQELKDYYLSIGGFNKTIRNLNKPTKGNFTKIEKLIELIEIKKIAKEQIQTNIKKSTKKAKKQNDLNFDTIY